VRMLRRVACTKAREVARGAMLKVENDGDVAIVLIAIPTARSLCFCHKIKR